ncbi:MAG: dihydrodipicolinate synthase family protein [Gemmatimonadota bacterium]
MTPDLGGVFLPVTTPFDGATGDVDLESFRDNLEAWFSAPLQGVLVAGSTGEAVFLEEEERRMLLGTAVKTVGGRGLVIMGAGAESTRQTARRVQVAADLGADAVLVKPPAYYRGAMTPEALSAHYRAVADVSPIPVVIYQVPLRMSTLDLPTGLVAELSRHENIVGIKDSRGSVELVRELVSACASGFQVLVGSGAALLPAMEAGAVGGIVAVGLLAPEEAVGVARIFRKGRMEEARTLQERIAPVHTGIVAGMGVPGIKAALDLLGLKGGSPRMPLLPPGPDRRAEVERIVEELRRA